MQESQIIIFSIAGTFLFTLLIMVFMMRLIAKAGWSKLADKYRCDEVFEGEKVGVVSMRIRSAQYNGSIVMSISGKGIYLKPMRLFRASHPPLLLPIQLIADLPGGIEQILNTGLIKLDDPPATIRISPKTILRLRAKLEQIS